MIGLESEERPLGTFFIPYNESTHKSKRININPRGGLSCRYRHKCSGGLSIPEIEYKHYRKGETGLIFKGVKNRIQNKGSERVVFTKALTRRSFREDDIARIKDYFKRT